MGLPTGSFADVETGFETLPGGTYEIEVTDYDIRNAGENAKHPGSQYINWTLTVQDDEQFEGRKLFTSTSLVPEAKGILKSFLLAVGYTEEDLSNDDFELEPDEIVGRRAKAVVSVRKANDGTDDMVNRVKRLIPSEGGDLPS